MLAITIIGIGLAATAIAKLTGSLSEQAISERLKPMGQVKIDGTAAAAPSTVGTGLSSAKDIYTKNCKMCHETGLAGAPKYGNKADWAPRISQGLEVLVKAAWSGIRAMPPKGNCLQCSEDDIRKTVEFMINAAK